jgi:hypothetical protein
MSQHILRKRTSIARARPTENKNKQTLALVVIVKDETRYILEWIAYYRIIGVTDIVLYDNDSDDEGRNLLERLAAAGIIKFIRWPTVEDVSPQLSAYGHALVHLSRDFEFLAFLDADEFLCLTADINLSQWLAGLPDAVGAIAINQHVFGSSGRMEAGDGLVTERFTLASDQDYSENKWVKSIYRTDSVRGVLNPHRGILRHGNYLLPNGAPAFDWEDVSGKALGVDFSMLKINHYIIKSLEEFLVKRARGGGAAETLEKRLSRYENLDFFYGRDERINSAVDRSLADMSEAIKREIAKLESAIG